MTYTFNEIRNAINYPHLKTILNEYNDLFPNNIEISRFWRRNYSTLKTLLDESDYEGDLNEENIINYFRNRQLNDTHSDAHNDDGYAVTHSDTHSDDTHSETLIDRMTQQLNNRQTLTVDINSDENLKNAFIEVLRNYLLNPDTRNVRTVLMMEDLNGNRKYITLNDESRNHIDNITKRIDGTLTENDDRFSGDEEIITGAFVPVTFRILFPNYRTNDDLGEEIDISLYNIHDGGFWKYVNLSGVNLEKYQIYDSIQEHNYTDNCFVYACKQSNKFTENEIEYMRTLIRTRKLPNRCILKIAKIMECNFKIKRIDESLDIKHQIREKIDTRKNQKLPYDREVTLLLYKGHYMLYDNVPLTTYYITHKNELDKKFEHITLEKRQLIKGINKNGHPIYKNQGTLILTILRKMFELNLFREINTYEYQLLETCEYNNKLNDYTDLDYNEHLCTREAGKQNNFIKKRRIYYADFETDVTVSPHVPYLCCVATKEKDKTFIKTFTGNDIANELLNHLIDESITYFHNLKYDVCFFINTPGWYVDITERNGTVLKVVMQNYIGNKVDKNNKTLTFKNSYSIIPAPLRDFAQMFQLDVHKEIMPYRLYTEKNLNKKLIDPLLQYYNENKDRLSINEFHKDCLQLMKNINISKSMHHDKIATASDLWRIDILKYASFYCMKDCIVLMQGLEKFNNDLEEVFKHSSQTTIKINVHNFISISAIGYDFAKQYGCFNDCYELAGKPQNFISRCISGGRVMTKNNEKQLINGKIQDFDAVSLYPSAMYAMDGIPKGIPKILTNLDPNYVLQQQSFFVEIKINKISCKSKYGYSFGQIYRYNKNGSKIFDNCPVDSFYVDKRALLDLIEYYDIDYDIIRGYYFDEGFNNAINEFIYKLFNLRKKYKQDKNPLQNTIKLLLNSIYGKSILKPIKHEIRCVNKSDLEKYILMYYNYIEEVNETVGIDKVYIRKIKPINEHFNLPHFGVSVLSWSKYLMNRVMCLAEQHNIPIFYQDTDSMHLYESDVDKIATLFYNKFNQILIGEDMLQFHNDFDGFSGSVGKIYSRKLIALGKKSYLDILVDENGNEGYHIRLKGVPKQVILNKCKLMNITVEELFMKLYNGEEIEFNLLDGSNAFRKNKTYQQTNLIKFNRRVKF